MGTPESNTSSPNFEFSSAVKESGINHVLLSTIFAPLVHELAALKGPDPLVIEKDGTDFELFPPKFNILKFHAVDNDQGTIDQVTSTEGLIEDKIVDKDSGKILSHLWNSPQALERVQNLLKIFDSNKQIVLFDTLA